MLRQDQVAGEVLVLWVRLDYLRGVNRLADHLAWHVPTLQAHVDVVGPQTPSLSHAGLDEGSWIIRELPIR